STDPGGRPVDDSDRLPWRPRWSPGAGPVDAPGAFRRVVAFEGDGGLRRAARVGRPGRRSLAVKTLVRRVVGRAGGDRPHPDRHRATAAHWVDDGARRLAASRIGDRPPARGPADLWGGLVEHADGQLPLGPDPGRQPGSP